MLQLTIAALLGLVSLSLPHVKRPPVSYTPFQRITEGMSTKEVATLLGSPPGDHRTDGSLWPRFPIPTWYSRQQTWWGDEGVILIGVGEDGKVDHMGFVGMERDFNVRPLLEQVRDRFCRRIGWTSTRIVDGYPAPAAR